MNDYYIIQTPDDINSFIVKTNALHDGYIIAVEYKHNGIKTIDSGYEIRPELTELIIRILVTSIEDSIVEIVFNDLIKWKITDSQTEILEDAVLLNENGWFVWTDDASNTSNFQENDSYIIAKSIKWRIFS